MSSLEELVKNNLESLLADTTWKSPSGSLVSMSLYEGRLPDRGAGTAVGIDAEEPEYEEPFVLVRETGVIFAEPSDASTILLYAQLWDGKESPGQVDYDENSGRNQLRRLAEVLRGLIRSEGYYPWSVEEEMEVQFGDEFGNQSDPEFVAVFKMKFYKGTESYG